MIEYLVYLLPILYASEVKRRKLELSRRIEGDTAVRAVSPPLMYLLKVYPTHLPLMHRRRCFFVSAPLSIKGEWKQRR